MDLPKRPSEFTRTLASHAQVAAPPVFVYRPPRPSEAAEYLMRLQDMVGEDEDATAAPPEGEAILVLPDDVDVHGIGRLVCELFDTFILRIEGLTIGGEPFDPAQHLDDIPALWKIEVGTEILSRLRNPMTELELGNSPSPSLSEETTAAMPIATGAAAE